jgi:predicted metal-binding membrane protein
MDHVGGEGQTLALDRGRDRSGWAIGAVLVLLAAIGWWWSVRSASDMTGAMGMDMDMDGMDMDGMSGMAMTATHVMTFGAFVLMWFAMMTAMMFPAISPVVRLYARAATAGRVAPLPFFVSGYIAVWTSLAIPAYLAWRVLMDPIEQGAAWAAYVAGGVLIAAAVWQLTPLKSICLRHCRSPLSVFLSFKGDATKPLGALRMGGTHGLYCLGCCWALMAVLVAVGTMNLAWMLGLSLLIFVEKNVRWGEGIARGAAVALLVLGAILLLRPETIAAFT